MNSEADSETPFAAEDQAVVRPGGDGDTGEPDTEGVTGPVSGVVSGGVADGGVLDVAAEAGVEGDGGSADADIAVTGSADEQGVVAGPGSLVRLQKVLAAAGVASRRASEQLIAAGRVQVDGQVVDQLGARVDPQTAKVSVDGRRVSVRPGVVHLALNKPKGVLSAMADDRGRPTVGDLVRDRPERLFHVGRLDADSEGLLLLTNDGDLAHQLMHPSFGVRKTYLVEVEGVVPRSAIRHLLAGVQLEDGPARVDTARVIQGEGSRTLVEVVLHEGRNRIVRRLFAAVGHPVVRLVRTAIGPLQLGGQRAGTLRELSQDEVSSLYSSIDLAINQ